MEQDENKLSNSIAKGANTANMVKGAVKTGKAIAGIAKGAAAGGPFGAVAGFITSNRKAIGKIVIATVVALMLPIMFILMLPALIFGGLMNAFSPDNSEVPILNDNIAITENMADISSSISTVLSEALTEILQEIDSDFIASGAEKKEIINPHENSPDYNSNAFISQYCAYKNEDFETISITDMEDMLREAKGELYSYTKKIEFRTDASSTTTVDTNTGEETISTTEVTEEWAVYTIVYNGEAYFADNVFGLTPEQKNLAKDYAQNLSTFFEDSMFQELSSDEYNVINSLGDIKFTDGQTDVVYFNQLDERYASKPYGTDNIGGYGCGPTAMAIVVSSLTDETVDPVDMAKWSYEHGYWCSQSGSYRSLISAASKNWNLPVENCDINGGQKIVDSLANGKLVVAIMTKGHFTSSGHFIVLRGVINEKVLVADPASYARSQQEWDLSIILDEASKHASSEGPFWIIG